MKRRVPEWVETSLTPTAGELERLADPLGPELLESCIEATKPDKYELQRFVARRPAHARGWSRAAPVSLGLVAAAFVALYVTLTPGPTPVPYGEVALPLGQLAALHTGTPVDLGPSIVMRGAAQVRVNEAGTAGTTLEVVEGEAAFEVDPVGEHRDLTVRVGSVEVFVVGTRFTVARESDGVLVAVTRGQVRVLHDGQVSFLGAGESERFQELVARVVEEPPVPLPIVGNGGASDVLPTLEAPAPEPEEAGTPAPEPEETRAPAPEPEEARTPAPREEAVTTAVEGSAGEVDRSADALAEAAPPIERTAGEEGSEAFPTTPPPEPVLATDDGTLRSDTPGSGPEGGATPVDEGLEEALSDAAYSDDALAYAEVLDMMDQSRSSREIVTALEAFLQAHPTSAHAQEATFWRFSYRASLEDPGQLAADIERYLAQRPESRRRTDMLYIHATISRDRLRDCARALPSYREVTENSTGVRRATSAAYQALCAQSAGLDAEAQTAFGIALADGALLDAALLKQIVDASASP